MELENFRHKAAHIYGTDSFDLRILWSTIATDIPTTLEYCQYALEDYDSHDGVVGSQGHKRMFGLR